MRYTTKAELVHDLRSAHDLLRAQLEETPKAHWRDRGGDAWTVSDLVAHLAEWQRLFLSWYEDGLEGITPEMPAPGYKWSELPRLNHAIWKKHRARSVAGVVDDFETGYVRILRIVEDLTSTELLNPWCPGMDREAPADNVPRREHSESLSVWHQGAQTMGEARERPLCV